MQEKVDGYTINRYYGTNKGTAGRIHPVLPFCCYGKALDKFSW